MHSENKTQQQVLNQFQRIRMLENRMRKQGKSIPQQQSLRSIKSTDSKQMFALKVGDKQDQQPIKNDESNSDDSENHLKLQLNIKNNKKITDYFSCKVEHSSAKNQYNSASRKQQVKAQKLARLSQYTQNNTPNQNKPPTQKQQYYIEQIKSLKDKVKIKQQQFVSFKNTMKKQMLDLVIRNHKMKRNQMRLRVNNNKIRLGDYLVQKKSADCWVDGAQIRQTKQKIEVIIKEKQQLEKNKKMLAKKSNKDFGQDPQQWKNALASQLYFLSREENHLQEQLKRLQEQKTLHIKELKLLYDQDFSKYGKFDQQIGTSNWPKIDRYQLLGLLGKGGFSQVYKAFDTEELRQVACKLHQLNIQWRQQVRNNFVKHALRQEQVHKMLDHPNIVRLYGSVQIDQNAFCTILQFCEGPDLSYYLKKHKKLPQKQAKMIIKQVINAIKYLHELPQKVIHYDLKPQNIMFHKGRVKITDFGLCKKMSQEKIDLTSQGVGTYWYLPPECFVEKPKITTKVDIWSIGVIYFEMLYGEKPFGNQMSQIRILNEGIMLKANTVNFPQTSKCSVSNQSKQFIKSCLKANVEQRYDIRSVVNHPLFDKK